MNYYRSRERTENGQATGTFHYTVQHGTGGAIRAVGPCAENCPGHATRDEAWRHAREGALTSARELDVNWTSCRAEIGANRCKNPANKALEAGVGGRNIYALCDDHRNIDMLRILMGDEEVQISSSY